MIHPDSRARIVSSEAEELILVDPDDNVLGYSSKAACHDGDGVLHRAFSIFLFDDDGRLLLQRRAAGKRLWPGYWSNTCCSHPRRGETLAVAAERRLYDELHTRARLEFVYRFRYQAAYGDAGSEHELCSVFLGKLRGDPEANSTEIDALRFIAADELSRELAMRQDDFTPWLKLEWRRLNEEFGDRLATYTGQVGQRRHQPT